MTRRFFVGVLFFLLISCGKNEKPVVAFYYWKTIFKLSPLEKEVLADNEVRKLYIRYFDIALHPQTKEPIPVSPVRFQANVAAFNVVPVVYIQNKVMLLPNLDVDDLAQKTVRLVEEINAKNKITGQEIQIDCDWTLNSKDNYLKFIERFRKISHKKLSATIRLHQVKYFRKTKIPNVDSGVLMYYNMGSIAPDSLNSIYSRKISEKYLQSLKKYPMHLDYALPVYSWAIHIRKEKILGLRSKLNFSDLKKDANFEQISPIFFRVKQSNYKNGVYYQEKDLLKTERISAEDLKEMATDLSENEAQAPKEIIFYDLDEFNIKNYEKNIFKQVISCF
ncbi:hypothetical protein BC749_101170 [Flavobacterium araucananum]|uniref:Lipoprotein n=1 Tax=Flavobacterium araucananum TaxID=946678 RepID=A0A227PES4_9FLAO|nr:hypothetical protein [Flavobacterium araucananum]OXG07993.1 hypothetical protein B0A64_06885 [Flavobacterium araucananum]PWK02109.1 hypothetical protein BC749_101170 [Flavobacterium araucananum]